MRILFIVLIGLFLSGCNEVNVVSKEVWMSLDEFQKRQVPKLIKYINEDKSLTTRDKNTQLVLIKNFEQSLKELKVQQ